MEAGIWVGFGVEFLLAIGVLSWILKKKKLPSWLKKNDGESPPPVCKSEVCHKLNDCMVRYMKKNLAFEDDSEEMEAVKRQLVDQINIHSGEDMTGSYISLKHIKRKRSEGRRKMMQCLRTTLVAHPDDIRGRRTELLKTKEFCFSRQKITCNLSDKQHGEHTLCEGGHVNGSGRVVGGHRSQISK